MWQIVDRLLQKYGVVVIPDYFRWPCVSGSLWTKSNCPNQRWGVMKVNCIPWSTKWEWQTSLKAGLFNERMFLYLPSNLYPMLSYLHSGEIILLYSPKDSLYFILISGIFWGFDLFAFPYETLSVFNHQAQWTSWAMKVQSILQVWVNSFKNISFLFSWVGILIIFCV